MNNPKGNAIIITLIIIVIIATAAAGYALLANNNANENANTANTNVVSITNTMANTNAAGNTNTGVDTSEWETYVNQEYGFRLRYPLIWTLSKTNHCRVINTVGLDCTTIILNLNPTENSTPPRFISLIYLGDIAAGMSIRDWMVNERSWAAWENDVTINGISALSLAPFSRTNYENDLSINMELNDAVLSFEWFDNGNRDENDYQMAYDILNSIERID